MPDILRPDPLTSPARTVRPSYMESYKEAFVEDTAEYIHSYDMAHVLMLGERGILPAETALELLAGLREMQALGMVACRRDAGGGNHAAENWLTERKGAAVGGAIGLARSSGDLSAISFRMYARHTLLELRKGLLGLREALVDFASRHVDHVLPGNTHGQHAQPITFALWAMMYNDALARDCARLGETISRANRSPAGAGIMSGTEFPIDRSRIATLLGFDSVLTNTLDAALSHDLEMEFASSLNMLCYTLSRMAEDLFLWNTTEYDLIKLPDWFIGVSSMMPQKRNPDGLQDLRNLSTQAQSTLTMVMGTERGPTGFPIIERRNSDRQLRDLAHAVGERLAILPDLLQDMVINAPRAENHANLYWASVTDLAGALVRQNRIDWRTAHGLVAGFVQDCIAQDRPPYEMSADDFNAYASRTGALKITLDEAVFTRALDARAFVSRRETFGGPGPEAMDHAISQATSSQAQERSALRSLEAKFAEAEEQLLSTIDTALKGQRFA